MKLNRIVCLALCSFVFFSACNTPTQIQTNEIKVETITSLETILINNCGGLANSEQPGKHSFSIDIAGLPDVDSYKKGEESLLAKYGQYKTIEKSYKLIAIPNTDMEFVLKWSEEIRTGTIKIDENEGIYSVRVPVSIEQVSSQDQGCPNSPTQTPEPKVTDSSPPTQTNIANLENCKKTIEQDICIGSISLVQSKNTLTIVVKLKQSSNASKYYILFAGKKYDCIPTAGFDDRYFCPGLPSKLDRKVLIRFFSYDSSVPLAEGNIFLDKSLIIPTPTPRDPYKP